MAIQYDSKIIITFAERLYDEARWIVVAWAILGSLLGAGGGALTGAAVAPGTEVIFGVAGLFMCGVLGFVIGQARAFSLRLQAQSALCQVQIETNTRSGGERPST